MAETVYVPAQPDALFDANWSILSRAFGYASSARRREFAQELLRLESDVPIDWRAGVLVALALRSCVIARLGAAPDPAQVSDLAKALLPRFSALTDGDLALLVDLLNTSLDRAPTSNRVAGGPLIFYGSAVVALLRGDTNRDLQALTDRVADYYARHHDELERNGTEASGHTE